jgi:cholesterol oxidase
VERAYDVVVVGSGFGGGITACRLAEAGKRVCLLERGRRFTGKDFLDVEDIGDAPQLLWHETVNPGGLYDVRMMRDVTVVTASGVGGGSLVYASVQLRAPADLFDQGWPAAITRKELDRWYDKTEDALEPRTTPADPEELDKVRAFAAAGRLAGRDENLLPLAVHFGEPRKHPFSGVEQQGCQNLGRCDIGCPVNAMNRVDITYVARAETYGAEVYPLHMVTTIDPPAREGGNWRLAYTNLGDGDDGTVEAPTVVLAAGTLGTSRLLLQNRGRLPKLSPALGTRFSGNGDALGIALDPQAEGTRDANNSHGPVMTSKIDFPDRHVIMANGGLPPGFEGILEIARGINVIKGWRRWLLRLKQLLTHAGLSDQPVHPREFRPRPREPDRDALIFLMMGRDAADGRMRLTPLFKRFDIRWDKAASKRTFDDLERSAKEVAAATDATLHYALDAGPLGTFATSHPLGGCPMADDPERGVVDDLGRVYNYPGLYVLDGSIVPTALGVNPSKTIAALAERGAANLVAEL